MRRVSVRGLVLAAAVVVLGVRSGAMAAPAQVTGGSATVVLPISNPGAGGWTLIGVSSDVTPTPGVFRTVTSVGVPVNSRTDAVRPTDATYNTSNPLATFAGDIEMRGYLTYLYGSGLTLELGDFSLSRDAARAGMLGGLASGYYLRSNRPGGPGIAFDIQSPTMVGDTTSFTFGGTLLASPELGQFFQPFGQAGFVGSSLGSINIGGAAQPGASAVPLPAAFYPGLVVLVGMIGGCAARKRFTAPG
jgi:hypothetical protein